MSSTEGQEIACVHVSTPNRFAVRERVHRGLIFYDLFTRDVRFECALICSLSVARFGVTRRCIGECGEGIGWDGTVKGRVFSSFSDFFS